METLEFYDLGAKKRFRTSQYRVVMRSGRKFAVAMAPSGKESWRILGKA